MVIGNLTDVTIENLINQLSSLTTFLQAIGGLIILYIVFGVINFILNSKKRKELTRINKNLGEIKEILKGKKIKK